MKTFSLSLLLVISGTSILVGQYDYEPTISNPFGMANPDAPAEIKEYQPMIGICDCKSISKNKEGNWADPVNMTWEFKYIMNGMAVQDLTLKEDGSHSGSIRQYIADSTQWYVHYYSSKSPTPTLGTWKGGQSGNQIILYKSQKAPNGTDGSFKITFKDITENGFNWLGEWVNVNETFSFPTWKIECKKRKQ